MTCDPESVKTITDALVLIALFAFVYWMLR